jgi:putative ABC transport system permease protein
VIGVVGNTRTESLATAPAPMLYLVHTQNAMSTMSLIVRSAAGPGAVASAVRSAVHDMDSELPVGTISPLSDLVDDNSSGTLFRATLIVLFAAAALLLASLGIYGLMSYSVGQRHRELGVRLALGASPAQLVREIVSGGLRLAGLGLLIGIPVSLALARVIGAQLYNVEPGDPATLVGVALLLLAVAFAGSWLPARRVNGIDPLTALRAE